LHGIVPSGGIDVSETAVAADPAEPVSPPGGEAADPAGLHWLTSAVEMAARSSGNWPLARDPSPRRWSSLPRIAIRTAGPGPGSVRAAREFTFATLRRWGAAERCDDIVVVVSELLTNAFRHAAPGRQGTGGPRWQVRFALIHPGPCVLCAVSDPSDQAPSPRQPGSLDETGRGLHVVTSLSDVWGCAPARVPGPGPAGPPAPGSEPTAAAVAAGFYPAPPPAPPTLPAPPPAGPADGFYAAPLPASYPAGVPRLSAAPGLDGPGPGQDAAEGKVVWAMFATGPAVPLAPARQAPWEDPAADGPLAEAADRGRGGYPASSAYLLRAARAHRHGGSRTGRRRFG
jgi:hypothetical protein